MTTEPEWAAEPTGAYLQFGVPGLPYSAVRVPITMDAKTTAAELEAALKTARWFAAKYAETFPTSVNEAGRAQEARSAPPQRQAARSATARGRPPQRGGQGRADQYPLYEGAECDICGGPVGVYPKRGNMRSDKLVCLGTCKDDQFIHTVGWLDDESPF